MEKRYFIVRDGRQVGPLTMAQLQNQRISAETLCWYENLSGWTKAQDLPELSYLLDNPPPPPSLESQRKANQSDNSGNNLPAYEYYLTVWRKYAEFKGRARRSEFWYFILFNTIVNVFLLYFIEANPYEDLYESLYGLYYLATIIPSIAVMARRIHDVGESGWLMLVPIYNFILLCKPGDIGVNKYGEDPKP